MKASSTLIPYLANFRRQLRLRDGWLLAQRTLWISIAGLLAILIGGRFWPIERIYSWAFAPVILWLCAVVIYTFFQPQSFMRVAQRVDLELHLKERLSTAFQLESEDISSSSNLPIYQKNDALSTAQTIDPHRAFPLRWLRRPILVAAALLLITLVLVYLPNPMETVLAERAAVEQAAQEQAERIEEFKQDIEQNNELSPEMQAELLRQLEELAQQLSENPGDRERALAELSRLEEDLRRQVDPNIDLSQASLESIAAQLQSLAQQEDANPPTPSEALEQIAEELANLNEAERQELAKALAQMAAQAAQSGDEALAQALAAISQAALSGNATSASQAASEASEAFAQAQQNLTDQRALQQILGQLQNSSQAVAQAGQGSQQVTGQGPGQGNQGNMPGQGSNPGQGQSGQGMSGGGTKADTLPPGTGSGQARRPNELDTGVATGDLGDQVFVPWERRPSEGQEVSIPGQDTGQGQTITRESPNPSGGLPGPALIPYQQVYTEYIQAAQQAMERANIPPAYRDLVRDYFTQLEP